MKEKQEFRGLQIRFPMELYGKLKDRAKESRRSFNSEVIANLELILAAIQAYEEKKGK